MRRRTPLQIIGRTRRDLAVKNQRFRCAPAHQYRDAVFEIAGQRPMTARIAAS
jgi:hypothetical protein